MAVAKWPSIITLEEGEAVRAVLNSRRRLEAPARINLLTGLLVCGVCGKKLVTNNKDGFLKYICRKDTVTGRGCEGVYVTAEPVENFLVTAVLTRLNFPEMEKSLSQTKPNPKLLAVSTELAGLDDRYIEFAEIMGQGEMTRVEYQAAKKIVDERKADLERSLAKERGVISSSGALGSPELISKKWKSLNLDRQRAILKAILESVYVDKVIQRGMPFNPQRLRPIWRF